MAYGTQEWRYSGVVAKVLDSTHVMIDERHHGILVLGRGSPVPLDGIVAPEKGSPEDKALRDVLEKTLLGKKVNVIEITDMGTSHGISVYVTDDSRRRAPEDNVNLMLVREGFARYSGTWNSSDGNLGGLKEAQRLAQEEKKGIWAYQEVTPEIVQPPASFTNRYSAVVTDVPDTTHVTFGERKYVYVRPGDTMPLIGIAVPEKGSPEEAALRDVLEKTLLDKQVNVIELCSRASWGVSVYVTDDKRRFAPEDNVNLMLVREGFARYGGMHYIYDAPLGGLREAQRLAQEGRKGIWAHYKLEASTVQETTPETETSQPPSSFAILYYSTVVTNVPDTNRATFGKRLFHVRMSPGYMAPLDGIAAPEKGSPEEEDLYGVLGKTLLGKWVNVVECRSKDTSFGYSIYVTDDPQHFAPEDNVNLMLVREGFARFSGELNSTDELLGGMAEAQRLAQEERKGIWANCGQEATPAPVHPPVAVETAPSNTVPVTDTQPPPEPDKPVNPKTIPWKLPLLISVIIIGTIGGWRYFRKKEK